MTDLKTRLVAMTGCHAGGPQTLRNPDGPEALRRIEELEAVADLVIATLGAGKIQIRGDAKSIKYSNALLAKARPARAVLTKGGDHE